MLRCPSCTLHFDTLTKAGKCESCTAERNSGMADDQELAALRSQVGNLEGTISRLSGAGGPPQPVDQRQAINQAFWASPADASYALATRAAQEQVGGAMAASFDALREVARDKARNANPELFDRFADKIEAHMANLPRDFQINKQYWQAAAERMIGAHYTELRREVEDQAREGKPKAPAFHGSNDGPAGVGTRPAPVSTGGGDLDDTARMVARRLRISDDQMKKGIELFKDQGDLLDPTKPSTWDRVMSFDDQTGPRARAIAERKGVAA